MSSISTPKLSLPLPLTSLSLPSASPSSPRTRSASLSQARSPVSSSSYLPDPSHPPHHAYSPSHAHAHAHSQSHPPGHGPGGHGFLSPSSAKSHRRVMSLHHLPTLSTSDENHIPINPPSPLGISDEDENEDKPGGLSRARRDTQHRPRSIDERNDEAWDRDPLDQYSDDEMAGLVTELELDAEEEGSSRYDGPFQAMDAREVVGIVLSVGLVLLLAISAGLTTIYDWVL